MVSREDRWYDVFAPTEYEIRAEYEEKLDRARRAHERRQAERKRIEDKRKEEDDERKKKLEERKKTPSDILRYRRETEGSKEWSPRAAGLTLGNHHLGVKPKNFLEVLEEIKASHPDIELVENQPGSEAEEIEELIETVEEDLEEASDEQKSWFKDQAYVWDYLPEGKVAVYYLHGREMDLIYFSPEAVEAA